MLAEAVAPAGTTEACAPVLVQGDGIPQEPITDYLARTPRLILSIGLLSQLADSLWGPRRTRWWCAAVLVAGLPLIFDILLSVVHRAGLLSTASGGAALFYFALVNLFSMWCPDFTWYRFVALGPALDILIPEHQGRQEVVKWLDHKISPARQLTRIAGGTVVGLAFMKLVVEPRIEDAITFGFASYVSLVLTMFLGFENVYWVLSLPLLVRRVTAQDALRLVWHYPAGTPALEGLSRLLGWTAVLGVMGLTLLLMPVAYVYAVSGTLPVLLAAVLALTAALVVIVLTGVHPQFRLYRLVKKRKSEVLLELSRVNGAVPGPAADAAELEAIMARSDLFKSVIESPNWTLRHETVVQYAAALLGAVAGIVLTIIAGRK